MVGNVGLTLGYILGKLVSLLKLNRTCYVEWIWANRMKPSLPKKLFISPKLRIFSNLYEFGKQYRTTFKTYKNSHFNESINSKFEKDFVTLKMKWNYSVRNYKVGELFLFKVLGNFSKFVQNYRTATETVQLQVFQHQSSTTIL